MRIDHLAFRVADRRAAARFFIDALGYRLPADLPDGFLIPFDDGSRAECLVLEPAEKSQGGLPWIVPHLPDAAALGEPVEYHLAPEIFISDGTPGSIVGEWVAARGGVGGLHHIAFQVADVEAVMRHWQVRGYAEFTTADPIRCPGLTQVFTKPSALTGVIFEFIERGQHGFCRDNVKDLMQSTRGL